MSKQTTRQRSRPAGHREEPRRREEEQQRIVHARRTTIVGIIAVGMLVVVGLVSLVMRQQHTPAAPTTYPAVDHIPCQNTEQSNGIHIHTHVTIYINGKRALIPAHVGIAPDGSCLYWLHTHDDSGAIHIEIPHGVAVTFGNFLDIWEQRFQQLGYPGQFSDPAGWQVYVNGKPSSGDFRRIPLSSHLLITLAYHSPSVKPDTSYPWNGL